ncbi:MAG: hypothetical protein JEZ06_12165 [Anaerolineaceae bacterium]|nr:hypothetical protein [Anaerolineaceae bacterium]
MFRRKRTYIMLLIILSLISMSCEFISVADVIMLNICNARGKVFDVENFHCVDPESEKEDQLAEIEKPEGKEYILQNEEDGPQVEQIEDQSSDQALTLEECNGSEFVTISVGEAEKSKQGNCRYLVSYSSYPASNDVSIYAYETHTNPSSGLNHEWYLDDKLSAGNESSEYQTIFADGETSTVDRVAIVFTSAECTWVGADQDSLDKIAQELANPCR